MRYLWIPLALALVVVPALCAQQQSPSQSAPIASANSDGSTPSEANGAVAPEKHAVAGAPSMEIGVDNIHTLDSDEVTTESLEQQSASWQTQPAAKSAKQLKKERSEQAHEAYRQQMQEQYPGWYY